MELFKLFGTIGLKGVEETRQGIDETAQHGEQSSNKLQQAFKKIGAAVATYFAIDKIKQFGQECVNMAAEVSAETSAFEQIMGDYSDTAKQKMQSVADATGVVDTRLTTYMTSMTAKFKGLGFDIDDATTLAADGLTLASDAAAFWDKSLDESMGSLNSFINGSYEGGEAIGLFANDTQMAQFAIQKGLVASTTEWQNLDEATKQATRLEYAQKMYEQSGATGQAAKEANQYANTQANLNEKWRQFKALIGEPILQNIVNPAMQVLSNLIDGLIVGFKSLTDFINNNKTAIELIGIALGTLTAAIIAYNIAQNAATILITLHTAATTVATATTSAFGAVLAFITSPITLVVAAIGALIAIGVLLYKNWDEVTKFAIQAWTNIKNAVSKLVEDLKAKILEIWNNIKTSVINIVNNIKTSITNVWNNIKTSITNVINNISTSISSVFNGIKSFISGIFDGMLGSTKATWNAIKSAIQSPIESAIGIVKNAINKIRGAFNFTWSLPHLSLPHISISGKFSLKPPSVPHFGISWYKKAMDEPFLLTSPTIFGMDSLGNFRAGGENGDEMIYGHDSLMNDIREASGNKNLDDILGKIYALLLVMSKNMNTQIVLDNGTLVGALLNDIDSGLGNITNMKLRGVK